MGGDPDSQQDQQDFKLVLAKLKFLYKASDIPDVDRLALKEQILDIIHRYDLTPVYEHFCLELGWMPEDSKIANMKEQNASKLAELDASIQDSEANLGETEVRDALQAKADYLARIGDKAGAIEAYKKAEEKTAGMGSKVEMLFSQIRLFILYNDWLEVKKLLAKAKVCCDEGGDWEHKNKLKVYEGVFAMYCREFKKAAELFLDSTATFTTNELFPYSQCIFYAVVTSMISLDRVELKKRVVDAPEILTVIDQIPYLSSFLNSLYSCKYAEFLKAFLHIMDSIRTDMYLHPHLRYYLREIRVLAYSQFLESYKSVTLDSMAQAFDVSESFLDQELSNFIVAGRLNAKIDKVAGIVETNRPDAKNALYLDSIRKGDLLLNRIQKLSRVIDIE